MLLSLFTTPFTFYYVIVCSNCTCTVVIGFQNQTNYESDAFGKKYKQCWRDFLALCLLEKKWTVLLDTSCSAARENTVLRQVMSTISARASAGRVRLHGYQDTGSFWSFCGKWEKKWWDLLHNSAFVAHDNVLDVIFHPYTFTSFCNFYFCRFFYFFWTCKRATDMSGPFLEAISIQLEPFPRWGCSDQNRFCLYILCVAFICLLLFFIVSDSQKPGEFELRD